MPLVRSGAGEEIALSVLRALSSYVEQFSDDVVLQEFVKQSALFVLLLNPPSSSATMCALGQLLASIAEKIGATKVCDHMLPYLRQFFGNYDEFYELTRDGNVLTKTMTAVGGAQHAQWTRRVYSSEMISILYIPVRDLVTANVVRREIQNSILLEAIVKQRYVSCFAF